jgi:hypothetical protein
MATKVINIDSIPGITSPLSVIIGGKTFSIDTFSKDLIDKTTMIADQQDDTASVHDVLAEQLVVLVGGGEEEKEHFLSLDGRILRAALGRIMDELVSAGERKNRGGLRKK